MKSIISEWDCSKLSKSLERWYRVPAYQRPYVWGTDQVNDLQEDLAYALSTNPNGEYFLGSLILHKRLMPDAAGKEHQENDLLDGQQRLATCLMLHAVVRDMTQDQQLKATCRQTIFQEKNPHEGTPERFRIVYDSRADVRDFVTKLLKPDGCTDNHEALKTAQNSKDACVRNMANAVIEMRRYFSKPDAPRLEQFFPLLPQQGPTHPRRLHPVGGRLPPLHRHQRSRDEALPVQIT